MKDLHENRDLKRVLYCTTGQFRRGISSVAVAISLTHFTETLDNRFAELKDNEKNLEAWVCPILYSLSMTRAIC